MVCRQHQNMSTEMWFIQCSVHERFLRHLTAMCESALQIHDALAYRWSYHTSFMHSSLPTSEYFMCLHWKTFNLSNAVLSFVLRCNRIFLICFYLFNRYFFSWNGTVHQFWKLFLHRKRMNWSRAAHKYWCHIWNWINHYTRHLCR